MPEDENTPVLHTERLVLRKFTADDSAALFEILSDTEVNMFLPWFPLKSAGQSAEFLRLNFLEYYKNPSAYRYAVCLKGCCKPVGYIWLSDDDSHDLGYGLAKEYWHRGIAAEAAQAVASQIRKAGYSYITATHDVNNPRSGAVMKKIGMTYKYSYVEQWQPKDIPVTFRMYQLNFDGKDRTYMKYWNKYDDHFIEDPSP